VSAAGLRTAVVVVNYRTKELTEEAVTSVLGEPEVGEVVVVDNASGDGSAEYLSDAFEDERVRVVASSHNAGFGAGVNLAARGCRSPLLLLLNSDARLVPGSLGKLARALVASPAVGAVAPAVYESDGRTLQPGTYGRLPARRDIFFSKRWARPAHDPAIAIAPGWVSGVAMLLRRADFEEVGGFDETFTMYLEDVDLCRRLGLAGKSVRREPSAAVVHLGGASWDDRRGPGRRFHESKLRYYEKLGVSGLELGCVRAVKAIRSRLGP
jgi:N-acetylglucosaminyl-diphospho-decaprenol L-rhamnosyltransferase